jgi:predicted ATPase
MMDKPSEQGMSLLAHPGLCVFPFLLQRLFALLRAIARRTIVASVILTHPERFIVFSLLPQPFLPNLYKKHCESDDTRYDRMKYWLSLAKMVYLERVYPIQILTSR